MKQKFIDFLKEHNAYESYINNLEKDFEYRSLDHFYKTHDVDDWLVLAFIWKDTSEGYEYWENLQLEWYQIVNW